MIGFFRRIRKKFADDNKPIKYTRYAFGEIVLVVIGILIALSINNWNENKTQERKIIEALTETHRELSGDILESNIVIEFYRRRDSIINIMMTKELTAEDYRGPNGIRYAFGVSSYEDISIDNNGFESLMSNSNNLPKKYKALVESLKNIYIEDQTELERSLKTMVDAMASNYLYLAKNTNWYSELSYNRRLNEDAIDFYLNDPYFRNNVSLYQLFALQNFYRKVYQFRLDAEETYKELTTILELEDVIASDSTYYRINVKDYAHFLGTYKDSVNTAVISLESDKLFLQWNDKKRAKLFPISHNSFIQEGGIAFNTLELDLTDKDLCYILRFGKTQFTLKKID